MRSRRRLAFVTLVVISIGSFVGLRALRNDSVPAIGISVSDWYILPPSAFVARLRVTNISNTSIHLGYVKVGSRGEVHLAPNWNPPKGELRIESAHGWENRPIGGFGDENKDRFLAPGAGANATVVLPPGATGFQVGYTIRGASTTDRVIRGIENRSWNRTIMSICDRVCSWNAGKVQTVWSEIFEIPQRDETPSPGSSPKADPADSLLRDDLFTSE